MEKLLSQDQFNRAADFIKTKGRRIDRSLFAFHFENGPSDGVLDELAKYQNEDGGFGHALEPDLRTPLSSALAASIAMKAFIEVEEPGETPIVKKTISYLLESLDRKNWRWEIAPKGLNNHPHAPWWGAGDIVAAFRGCYANPTAEIVGQLLHYRDGLSSELLAALVEHCEEYLLKVSQTPDQFQMHDLICYLSLANSPNLDLSAKEKIIPLLREATDRIVETNKQNWNDYCARPLWICTEPSSFLYTFIKSSVDENLDYEIETQNLDGSWSPFWDWGESYPEVWPIAKQEWSSHLTLNNLLRLKKYARLNPGTLSV